MSQPVVDSDVTVIQPTDVDTITVPAEQQPLAVRSFGMTDPGRVRPSNEDQFLMAILTKALQVQQTSLPQAKVQYSPEQGHLFVVADGVGGHAGGEKASALAVDAIESFVLETFKWFRHLKGREGDKVLAEFQQALGRADAKILGEAAENPKLHGMATTLTMAYNLNDELFVAHVGDSRCYLLRERALYQLTQDHTMVQEMVNMGHLKPEEAAHHHFRHVVTNVVGGREPGIRVEVHKVHLEPGDVLLLCSDGLTEMVPDDEIAAILQGESDPAGACKRLVGRANEQGGKDNITVVVARFEEPAV